MTCGPTWKYLSGASVGAAWCGTQAPAYMYAGAWVPHQAAPTEAPDKYFHVGPHVMVVSPHQDELQAFTRDAASGMPYINHLPQRTEVFVVIPMRQWEEQPR